MTQVYSTGNAFLDTNTYAGTGQCGGDCYNNGECSNFVYGKYYEYDYGATGTNTDMICDTGYQPRIPPHISSQTQ